MGSITLARRASPTGTLNPDPECRTSVPEVSVPVCSKKNCAHQLFGEVKHHGAATVFQGEDSHL